MVADDYQFKSITEIWLGGDHYKWRAMRSNGVDERYCTGKDTTDWEKFEKWAETVPYTFRNPLYHWTHLELKTAFGIDKTLNPSTAREIFEECNAKLATPEYSARKLDAPLPRRDRMYDRRPCRFFGISYRNTRKRL